MKKKTRIGLNIGTSSILLVFVLLCMVTFAVLSFVSANADYKLSRSLGDRTAAYYEVSNLAEQQLQNIHEKLELAAGQAANTKDYSKKTARLFTGGTIFDTGAEDVITSSYEAEGSGQAIGTLTWQLCFTDSQALEIKLTLLDPFSNSQLFRVDQWKVVTPSEWEDDAPLNLYDGT